MPDTHQRAFAQPPAPPQKLPCLDLSNGVLSWLSTHISDLSSSPLLMSPQVCPFLSATEVRAQDTICVASRLAGREEEAWTVNSRAVSDADFPEVQIVHPLSSLNSVRKSSGVSGAVFLIVGYSSPSLPHHRIRRVVSQGQGWLV